MPRLLPLLLALGLLGARVEAKPLTYPEHDLEFTAPSDWIPSPPKAGTVVVMHDQIPQKIGGDTTIGSKAVALMVSTFPQGVAIDTQAVVTRQREDLQQKGAVVVATGTRAVGPLLFYTTTLAEGGSDLPVSYVCTTFGNDRAVTLFLSSRVSDPSTEPQFDAILQSVHFLSPYRPIPELTSWRRFKAFARRHPIAVTVMGLVGTAALVVLGFIVKQAVAGTRPRRKAGRKG